MEYVELWYFTTEGITDASKITPTAADDTFGFMRTEAGLALQQIKASKASRNAICDEALSWEQIMTARHNILSSASMWPEKHRLALAEFFMNLEARKASGAKPRPLILYQATVRRRWHHALKGVGQPFNIAIINNDLLAKLENEIRDQDHEEMKKQASEVQYNWTRNGLTSLLPLHSTLLHLPPPPPLRYASVLGPPTPSPLLRPVCPCCSSPLDFAIPDDGHVTEGSKRVPARRRG